MLKTNFELFLSQLKETNATLGFFVDFSKVTKNVSEVEFKLNQLNFLLGKQNTEQAVRFVWEQSPQTFSVLNILIAVRDNKKVITDEGTLIPIESFFTSVDGVITFIRETGLQNMFQSRKIKNLVDYVFGVEVGLDTHSRKNRSGELMADRIAQILRANNVRYKREVDSTDFSELRILGKDNKRFDFVVQTKVMTYLIEVNFYSSGGSKLNEVARSYSDIGPKINSIPNFEFVWITDGQGWLSAKNKLEEAYRIIPNIYNLTTLDNFIRKIKADM